jgi:hypothetical protein
MVHLSNGAAREEEVAAVNGELVMHINELFTAVDKAVANKGFDDVERFDVVEPVVQAFLEEWQEGLQIHEAIACLLVFQLQWVRGEGIDLRPRNGK